MDPLQFNFFVNTYGFKLKKPPIHIEWIIIGMVNELQTSPQGLKFNYKPIESKYIMMNMQIGYQTSQDSNMLPYLHNVHGWIYNKNVKCQSSSKQSFKHDFKL
jgi:hypothetical protein